MLVRPITSEQSTADDHYRPFAFDYPTDWGEIVRLDFVSALVTVRDARRKPSYAELGGWVKAVERFTPH